MFILIATNQSQLAPISDYDVEVYINQNQLAKFGIIGHERAKGWPTLLRQIADQYEQQAKSKLANAKEDPNP